MIPKQLEVFLRTEVLGQFDRCVMARFDYDRGEPQRWNGLTGVGNPETPASVQVDDINIDGRWYGRDELPSVDWEDLEQQIMDKIIEIQSEEQADRSEAEYKYWSEQ